MERPSLLLPGHVADEFTLGVDHDITIAKRFNELLKLLDPQLTVFWVKPEAKSFPSPGRWHIARVHPHNPELNAYWCICTDAGGYKAPGDEDIDALKRIDTSTGQRTYNQVEAARTRKENERLAKYEEKRREFRETLMDRLSHLYDPKIAVTGAMKDRLVPAAPRSPKKLVLPDGVSV